MTDVDDSNKQRKIHFTISLDEDNNEVSPEIPQEENPIFYDDAELFDIANMVIKNGERNTEAGPTTIRVVDFKDNTHRKNIIELIEQSFQQVLSKLYPFLFGLGFHPRAEVRQRAAQAVGELMCEIDFIRLKEDIVGRWAKSSHLYAITSSGIALAEAAKDERYAKNVEKLVRHWSTTSNRNLQWSALSSCVPLASTRPDFALEIMEKSLRRRNEFIVTALLVIRKLCIEDNTDMVLRKLSEWINDQTDNSSLRFAAAVLFLEEIELEHIEDGGSMLDDVVTIFSWGIKDIQIAGSGDIRRAMFELLYHWMETACKDLSKEEIFETILMRLYLRAETSREKDLIQYRLDKWSKKDEKYKKFNKILID